MTDLRTAAQQALEALYQAKEFTELYDTEHAAAVNERCHENITALRAALAQQAEPAPMPPFPPVSQWNQGCAVCGIGADGKAYGYVCPRSDCPTKVTCGGVA